MDKRSFHLLLGLLALLYLTLACLYSVITPLFEAPDEVWHIAMGVRLAQGEGLPIQHPGVETPWQQEGSQPPLYYALLAIFTRLVGLPVEGIEALYFPNPHACPGDASCLAGRNIALHGPEEAFPWRGMALTLHLWRLISVGVGLLTILATVQMVRLLFPGRPIWALGSGLLVALNPMFLFISASVNNDVLVNALAASGLWLLALRWREGFSWLRALLLGVLLGAAALAKLSGLTLWPLALIVLLAAAYRERAGWRALAEVALVFAIATALCGWWFWRNWTLYDDPLGLQVMLAIVGQRKATVADLLREWEGMRRSFWGVFGWMNVLMPTGVYTALDLWTALAAFGFLIKAVGVRRGGEGWAIGAGLGGYVVLLLVAFLRWTAQTPASQGRLMFPAIGPLSLGLWVGWEHLVRKVLPSPALVRTVRSAPMVFLATLALLAPILWIAPAYRPLSLPVPADLPHPTEAVWGDEFRLLGYELQPPSLEPGGTLDLTLYLEALRPPSRDWSLFVHVVDDVGIILTQDDRYPQQGLARASRLQAGERWAEVFRLRVPATAIAPAHLALMVGFYDLRTGERLTVAGAADDRLHLGDLTLQPRPGTVPNPISYRFGEGIELVGFEVQPRLVRAGEAVTLTLYWRARRPIAHDYTVFTHILQPPQTIWGQEDRAPNPPTSQWQVGEIYAETYTLTLKAETPPGFYEIEIGLYRPATGERLRREDGSDFLLLSRIRVEAGPP